MILFLKLVFYRIRDALFAGSRITRTHEWRSASGIHATLELSNHFPRYKLTLSEPLEPWLDAEFCAWRDETISEFQKLAEIEIEEREIQNVRIQFSI